MTSLSDFPPDVQAAANAAVNEFLRDERCGTAARFGMTGTTRDALVEAIAIAIMTDRPRRFSGAGLTSRQADCLRFIADFQREHDGLSPSQDEIAAGLGLGSKSGVNRLVNGLEERGVIKRLPNRSRAITIIANPN